MSTIKIIVKEAIDTIEEMVPKVARGVAEKSTKLATKTRQIKQQIEAKDAELAAGQQQPAKAPQHDAPDPVTPRIDEQADASGIENPRQGMRVWRVYGEAQDAIGGLQRGSLPGGQSWTPVDPSRSADFRWDAGLPDENPGRFLIEGILRRPSHVIEVRQAVPLDGNPGGWPEYLIEDALDAIEIRDISGVNEPWTKQPGDWQPPARR